MAYFTPGKVFELQKWTEDPSLNGKILGIIDKKSSKQTYPCYIFENQQIVEASAAQLTYPELDAESKRKLQELLDEVIRQKKAHKNDLANKALEEEQRQAMLKKQRAEQEKIQKALPTVVFDTGNLAITPPGAESNANGESIPGSPKTPIVIKAPPKDLYKTEGDTTENIVLESEECGVPSGYALVPVDTLKQVVDIKKQSQELQQKELNLIAKENELHLKKKQNSMEFQKKELELERKKKEIDLDKKHVVEMEQNMQSMKHEDEIRRKQDKHRGREKKKRRNEKEDRRNEREEDEEERRKRKKKKKKKRKKKEEDECCTVKSLCKCCCKLSSICLIIAFVAAIIGVYFYFGEGDDQNVYAFLFWAGAIIAFVFGVGFLCK